VALSIINILSPQREHRQAPSALQCGTYNFKFDLPHWLEPPFGNCVPASPDRQRGLNMSEGDIFFFALGIATGAATGAALLRLAIARLRLRL